RVVVLEDYEGRRETRIGESVMESELVFERSGERASGGVFSKAAQRGGLFEDAADDDLVKGTPRAAARALEQNVGATKDKHADAKPERDPTAYEDDKWSDSQDVVVEAAAQKRRTAIRPAPAPVAAADADDGWSDAAQLVRSPATEAPKDAPATKP